MADRELNFSANILLLQICSLLIPWPIAATCTELEPGKLCLPDSHFSVTGPHLAGVPQQQLQTLRLGCMRSSCCQPSYELVLQLCWVLVARCWVKGVAG